MPTGYTHKLYEGEEQSFADFALSCAHAFGALIELRDEGANAPIPEKFEPSSYSMRALARESARLADVQSWGPEKAQHEAENDYRQQMTAYRKAETDRAAIRKRYEDMLARVSAWTPPTDEHAGLRDFMVEQLKSSIAFDCGPLYEKPVLISGREFAEAQEAHAARQVAYYGEQVKAEVERAQGRTSWVRELRKSLGVTV